ncbi:hypothetical protein NM208_g9130 [Fusarium decemcellulare]|uniref:Uncharacterized protein n=1 Tax=Fusarium decemcellulare TaxID=57161 RepID=A0ACC1S2Q3_9HYPO|nr:hypothetical protein NM208_g9130 [Fusarium decemcellulare]
MTAAAVVPRIAREGFAVVGSRFEGFSISLATSVIPVVPIGDDDDDFYELPDISGGQKISASSSEPGARPDFQDTPQLIQLMPNLKSLTMHLYHTSHNDKIFLNSYSALLFEIFRSTALPQLRLLDLRGFPAQMTIINHILSRYPDIQSLRLQHMYFRSNEWSQAMSPLAKIDSPVSSLYLSDIWAVYPQEGLITNIVHAITNNLVAADPELIYLASNEEQRAEVTREIRLWIELSPKLSPPLGRWNGFIWGHDQACEPRPRVRPAHELWIGSIFTYHYEGQSIL